MCDLMGTEPIDSEIPIDFDDLPEEVQEAIYVYNMLQDNYDTMNGYYLGKNLSGLKDVFDIAEVEDRKTVFSIIQIIDGVRSKIINTKKPAK